jgi:hypothetical protein
VAAGYLSSGTLWGGFEFRIASKKPRSSGLARSGAILPLSAARLAERGPNASFRPATVAARPVIRRSPKPDPKLRALQESGAANPHARRCGYCNCQPPRAAGSLGRRRGCWMGRSEVFLPSTYPEVAQVAPCRRVSHPSVAGAPITVHNSDKGLAAEPLLRILSAFRHGD